MRGIILIIIFLLTVSVASACLIPSKCWFTNRLSCSEYNYELINDQVELTLILRSEPPLGMLVPWEELEWNVPNCNVKEFQVQSNNDALLTLTCNPDTGAYRYVGGGSFVAIATCPTNYFRYDTNISVYHNGNLFSTGEVSIPFVEPPDAVRSQLLMPGRVRRASLGIGIILLIGLVMYWIIRKRKKY